MEIKVDVHAVHPSSSGIKDVEKPVTKRTCGSWCTPDTTPIHNVLKQTSSNIETRTYLQEGFKQNKERLTQRNSNIETKTYFQEETKINKESILIDLQTAKLYSSSPPPQYTSKKDIRQADTELKDFKSTLHDNLSEKQFSPDENSDLIVETPQSPVPASFIKTKKCKRFLKLPNFCDPFVPIDPQGRVYITWLLLVTFCYSYNAWCIALRATFPYQTPENTALWMTADYLCDVVYLLDAALVKPRLIYLHDGFWVDDPEETRKNYRKKLQYKFDVISLLPFDILYFYFGTHMVILRWPRLLKLQTFWEFHQAMDRVLSSPYVVRIGKTLFYIFYLIHLNACAYYAMSDYIGLGTNGWVYDNQGTAYIRCFYFATKTATSIGKNPKPEDTIEYLFMTAAWLMGVFVFALLIGQIRDIIATATRARTEYRKTLDGCARYLRRLNMPNTLQRRVALWFNYTWTKQRCFDESKILNSLPFNMKRDVALAVHMSTLSKVQLFQDCSASLLRDLVLQLRPVSFLPGDVVVRRGDVGHQMYIISSGECFVMSQDENEVLATLREGSVFGEISLLGIDGLRRRTATVRSRGYSSLFALSKSDLDAALKYHKEAAQILRIRADHVIRENAARSAKQRMKVEAKQLSIQEENASAARRRRSSASSGSLAERRQRSASGLSKKRLSAVSEINQPPCPPSTSLASVCSRARTPVPKIILSGD